MSEVSPTSRARASGDEGHVAGEIVREQTVRAPIPTAPTEAEGAAPSGNTVRSPVPTFDEPMVPRSHAVTPAAPLLAAEPELEDLEVDEVDEVEVDAVELVEEELEVGRADPPAVAGEVIATPEPAASSRRKNTLRAGEVPDMRRSDPRVELGAVEVPVAPMGSDVISTSMSSSGPQMVVQGGGWQRPTTDPGSLFVRGFSEATGPQPVAQAESTGPHPVMGSTRSRSRSDSSNALWILAGVLVLLAATVLGFVLTR